MYNVVMWIALAVAAFALIDGLLGSRQLSAQLATLRRRSSVDPATDLMDRSALEPHLEASLARSSRSGASLHVWAIEYLGGQPDSFGQSIAGDLAYPDVGFRVRQRLFLVASPTAPPSSVAQASPSWLEECDLVSVGHASFPGDGERAQAIIALALTRLATGGSKPGGHNPVLG